MRVEINFLAKICISKLNWKLVVLKGQLHICMLKTESFADIIIKDGDINCINYA